MNTKQRLASILAAAALPLCLQLPSAFASIPLCIPGPADLLNRAEVVVVGTPQKAQRIVKDGRNYFRATYQVEKLIRGGSTGVVTIEHSCLDSIFVPPVPTAQNMGSHCKDGAGVGMNGFKSADGKFEPMAGKVILYLGTPGKSGLDAAEIHADVASAVFTACGPYSAPAEHAALVTWLEENAAKYPVQSAMTSDTPAPEKAEEPPAEVAEAKPVDEKPPAPEAKKSGGCSITGL